MSRDALKDFIGNPPNIVTESLAENAPKKESFSSVIAAMVVVIVVYILVYLMAEIFYYYICYICDLLGLKW